MSLDEDNRSILINNNDADYIFMIFDNLNISVDADVIVSEKTGNVIMITSLDAIYWKLCVYVFRENFSTPFAYITPDAEELPT